MNERFLELAKQAVFESYKAGCIDQKEIVLEKFAELIVRECVEVVKWTPSLHSNDEYIKNIKKHFGVE
jgi:hypothetical protein